MITTRDFVIDDYDDAVALWKLMEGIEVAEGDARDEIDAYLTRNPGFSRVAEEEDQLAAAVLCGHDGRRGLIYHLAVAPAYRGRGIGKLLVGECLSRLRSAGITRALILVEGKNTHAHAFWLGSGWEDVLDVIVMGIDL
jgi:ribosomal protein S18 acetylase RimI-like enzyme